MCREISNQLGGKLQFVEMAQCYMNVKQEGECKVEFGSLYITHILIFVNINTRFSGNHIATSEIKLLLTHTCHNIDTKFIILYLKKHTFLPVICISGIICSHSVLVGLIYHGFFMSCERDFLFLSRGVLSKLTDKCSQWFKQIFFSINVSKNCSKMLLLRF